MYVKDKLSHPVRDDSPREPHHFSMLCDHPEWVTSRNITSAFSTGCYAITSSPSVSFLATISERPEAAETRRTFLASHDK
jgi:hypothetical protein